MAVDKELTRKLQRNGIPCQQFLEVGDQSFTTGFTYLIKFHGNFANVSEVGCQ